MQGLKKIYRTVDNEGTELSNKEIREVELEGDPKECINNLSKEYLNIENRHIQEYYILSEADITNRQTTLQILNNVLGESVHDKDRDINAVLTVDGKNEILTVKILFTIFYIPFDPINMYVYNRWMG